MYSSKHHFSSIPPGKDRWLATPMYWFIMAPYKSPPFGSCAIYFHFPFLPLALCISRYTSAVLTGKTLPKLHWACGVSCTAIFLDEKKSQENTQRIPWVLPRGSHGYPPENEHRPRKCFQSESAFRGGPLFSGAMLVFGGYMYHIYIYISVPVPLQESLAISKNQPVYLSSRYIYLHFGWRFAPIIDHLNVGKFIPVTWIWWDTNLHQVNIPTSNSRLRRDPKCSAKWASRTWRIWMQ